MTRKQAEESERQYPMSLIQTVPVCRQGSERRLSPQRGQSSSNSGTLPRGLTVLSPGVLRWCRTTWRRRKGRRGRRVTTRHSLLSPIKKIMSDTDWVSTIRKSLNKYLVDFNDCCVFFLSTVTVMTNGM